VKDIRFDSTTTCRSGLHLNFSLYDASTGKAALQNGSSLTKTLQEETISFLDLESDLLFWTKSQQQRRYRLPKPTTIRCAHNKSIVSPGVEGSVYIENKCPGADANMHYAVLLQMAAIYEGLRMEKGHEPSLSLADLLNALEPNLGDRFTQAEENHTELRAYDHASPSRGCGR
jgi:glutamine synthetase